MVSSVFTTFCSIFVLLGASVPATFQLVVSTSGKTTMAMGEVDTRALLPLGSVFGNFIQCGGSPRTVAGAQFIGVCYSNLGNNLPDVREVVELYKRNGIGKMRIYEANEALLNALRGSNIEIILGVPNRDLERLANFSFAIDWVQKNIQAHVPSVKFRYIAVGNEWRSTEAISQYVLPAMQSIRRAIAAIDLEDQIKISTVVDTSELAESFPPSRGAFTGSAQDFIRPIITFLVGNGSPVFANVYTYFTYAGNPRDVMLSYALLTSQEVVVTDGDLEYRNLFEAIIDALYSALEKLGGENVPIVVSESGWPSNGSAAATVGNAGTYYKNLISYVHSGRGTPRRPGKALEAYLFGMFDENQKSSEQGKHFGLFRPNKQPKYQLSFS